MPYIGRQLTQGNFIKLDDLQSQFDGSKTTFNLTTGGKSFKPGSANALLISLGGVIQEVGSAFTVNNDQITFSNPPTADANIFIIALGNSVTIGTPADGTVTASKLSAGFGEYSGIGTIIMSGIVSATSVRGDGRFLTGVSAVSLYLRLLVYPQIHLLVSILQLLMIMILQESVIHSKVCMLQTE